jgi:hypothetical protein
MLGWFASLVAAYLVLMALLLLFEKNVVFFPNMPGRLTGNWQPPGLPIEDVWLTAEDGVKIHAWWIRAAWQTGSGASDSPGVPTDASAAPDTPPADLNSSGNVPTIIAFHGNAANLPNRADIYLFLRELPANVLAVEYRGYGKSEGSPSEEGIYRDARAAYDYLTKQRGIAPRQIIAYGASLGTAVAADLAAAREVGAIVLEAPFPSAPAVARRAYFFLPGVTWFMRTRLETSAKLERSKAPLLVLHCTHDPVIDNRFGEEVFRSARQPKQFQPLRGACHEGAFLESPEECRRALRELFARMP